MDKKIPEGLLRKLTCSNKEHYIAQDIRNNEGERERIIIFSHFCEKIHLSPWSRRLGIPNKFFLGQQKLIHVIETQTNLISIW